MRAIILLVFSYNFQIAHALSLFEIIASDDLQFQEEFVVKEEEEEEELSLERGESSNVHVIYNEEIKYQLRKFSAIRCTWIFGYV